MTEYAYCEPVTATTSSFEHIRKVPGDALRLGGGIEGKALCGRDMTRGWDNPASVTEHSVRLRSRRPNDQDAARLVPNPLCPDCANRWGVAEVEGWECIPGHGERCCKIHDTHSMPHRGCMLR